MNLEVFSNSLLYCLSNNSLISSWISAKFVSALLLCMLYLSYYYQSEVNILNVFEKGYYTAG